jgi:hypothetical protein
MIQSAAWIWCRRKMWFGITVLISGPEKTMEAKQIFYLNLELGSQVWKQCFTNWIFSTYQYSKDYTIYQVSLIRIFKLLGAHMSVPKGKKRRGEGQCKNNTGSLYRNTFRNQICQLQQHVSLIISLFLNVWNYNKVAS